MDGLEKGRPFFAAKLPENDTLLHLCQKQGTSELDSDTPSKR